MADLVSRLKLPQDLSSLKVAELEQVAAEIRRYMLRTVADNGGHLAASLGVVELTLALHSLYNSPQDKIIWDVGHQSYPHKLLTGRWDQFPSLRKHGGLSGFPRLEESEHDPFGTGHSSTSISAAVGLAKARDLKGENHKVIAVIGDGALTGGMSFEALNHAGHINADLMVILNDNKMSIGSNVGSLSAYLGRIRSDPKYSRLKEEFETFVKKIPIIGSRAVNLAERIKGGLKYLIVPGMLFEELGFTYFGPVDGHNIRAVKIILQQAGQLKGPVLVHVVTEKGKGYSYAEQAPETFHGIGPFDLQKGTPISSKKSPTYTEIFGRTLVEIAGDRPDLVAITAAMTSGTGLKRFAAKYPERFFDVGIAEQHAVTMAAALAAGGMTPVLAVYSTFLQRAYDQIIHDVCTQKLPVIFAVDRAGIVGEDGETHQGLFDISYLRSAPNMTVMAPADEKELRDMLYFAVEYKDGPVAIRYPRDKGRGIDLGAPEALKRGRGAVLREGEDLLIIAAGTMVYPAMEAAERLFWQGIKTTVVNPRFIKPLDEDLLVGLAQKCGRVITAEENILAGGLGSAVLELFENRGLEIPIKRMGIDDSFIEHGPRSLLLARYKLDADGLFEAAYDYALGKAARDSS